MIPTDGVKCKLDRVVHSVPLDEGCEVLDGEMNDEGWDKNGNKNVADTDDTHNLMKRGGAL